MSADYMHVYICILLYMYNYMMLYVMCLILFQPVMALSFDILTHFHSTAGALWARRPATFNLWLGIPERQSSLVRMSFPNLSAMKITDWPTWVTSDCAKCPPKLWHSRHLIYSMWVWTNQRRLPVCETNPRCCPSKNCHQTTTFGWPIGGPAVCVCAVHLAHKRLSTLTIPASPQLVGTIIGNGNRNVNNGRVVDPVCVLLMGLLMVTGSDSCW